MPHHHPPTPTHPTTRTRLMHHPIDPRCTPPLASPPASWLSSSRASCGESPRAPLPCLLRRAPLTPSPPPPPPLPPPRPPCHTPRPLRRRRHHHRRLPVFPDPRRRRPHLSLSISLLFSRGCECTSSAPMPSRHARMVPSQGGGAGVPQRISPRPDSCPRAACRETVSPLLFGGGCGSWCVVWLCAWVHGDGPLFFGEKRERGEERER